MEPLTSKELNRWLLDPATKKIRSKCEQYANDIQEAWIQGKFAASQIDDAEQRGIIKGMMYVFNVEEDIGDMDGE